MYTIASAIEKKTELFRSFLARYEDPLKVIDTVFCFGSRVKTDTTFGYNYPSSDSRKA